MPSCRALLASALVCCALSVDCGSTSSGADAHTSSSGGGDNASGTAGKGGTHGSAGTTGTAGLGGANRGDASAGSSASAGSAARGGSAGSSAGNAGTIGGSAGSNAGNAGNAGTSGNSGGSGGKPSTVFPVRYATDQRTLVDQAGVPFPILGRTAWFVISRPASDYRAFLDDTVMRGYDAIEMHVLDHDPRGNHPPFAGNGALPFSQRLDGAAWSGALSYANIGTEAPDFSKPNEAYWSFVDEFLSECQTRGLLVLFFPAYVGYAGGDQGFMREMVANGASKVQSYGAFLAARYHSQPNLVWMLGGDMGTAPNPFNTQQAAAELGLVTGLTSTKQQSIYFSAEWSSESIGSDQTDLHDVITLNSVYSWSGDVVTHGRRAYAHTPVLPAFLLEEPYDQEGPDGNAANSSATQPVRRFQWWGFLSTIAGYVSGNGYVWPFLDATWKAHLDTPGSRDMAVLNGFVRSIAWSELVPSGLNGMKTLVADNPAPASASYVAAAATPNGALLVAYVPPGHTGNISVDLSALSGAANARWFDPTSGVSQPVGSVPNTGPRAFTPPAKNAAGDADWVLVVEH